MTALMDWGLRLVLIGVFAVAAGTKLRDREAAREALSGLGIPRRLAFALAPAELAVAALLAVPGTAAAGAVAALGLLALFSAVIAANLAAGRHPACPCFGAGTAPIGPLTLLRNGALAVAAAGVLVAGAQAGHRWPAALAPGSFAVGALLAALLAAPLVVVLLRRHGRALARADRLAGELERRGIAVPAEDSVVGHPSPVPADGRPLVAIFTAPGCEPCAELAPRITSWRERFAGVVDVVELDHGEHAAAGRELGVEGTPGAVLVGPDGRIAADPAYGPAAVAALVSRVAVALPDVELADLDGALVRFPEELAPDTLLLFWSPECGFCRAMADDAHALIARREVVVVSTADAESLRAEGFACRVVRDPGHRLGSAVGALGTPAAVVAGPDGLVRGGVAVGGPAIRALDNPVEVLHAR